MRNSLDLLAIVVGDDRHTGITGVLKTLDRAQIPYVLCRDVYAATAELVGHREPGRFVLIGYTTTLSAHNMRLCNFASRHEIHVIGLLIDGSAVCSDVFGAFYRAGAVCAANTEVLPLIQELIINPAGKTTDTTKAASIRFGEQMARLADNYFITPEERRALKAQE